MQAHNETLVFLNYFGNYLKTLSDFHRFCNFPSENQGNLNISHRIQKGTIMERENEAKMFSSTLRKLAN